MSRGLWFSMNARTRRSLTLLWTALFLFSLALQSVTLATPTSVLAVHDEGVFELDGNALEQRQRRRRLGRRLRRHRRRLRHPSSSTDAVGAGDNMLHRWRLQGHHRHPALAAAPAAPSRTRTTSRMRSLPRTSREPTTISSSTSASTATRRTARRRPGSGSSRQPDRRPSGSSLGTSHSVGDVLVQIDFENGGTNPVARVYEWTASGLDLVSSGASCTAAGADDDRCAISNTANSNPAWSFNPKSRRQQRVPAGALPRGRHQHDRPRTG